MLPTTSIIEQDIAIEAVKRRWREAIEIDLPSNPPLYLVSRTVFDGIGTVESRRVGFDSDTGSPDWLETWEAVDDAVRTDYDIVSNRQVTLCVVNTDCSLPNPVWKDRRTYLIEYQHVGGWNTTEEVRGTTTMTMLNDAGKCLVVCGLCYVTTFIAQSVQSSSASALPAWIPIFIFGTVAVVLIDRIRT